VVASIGSWLLHWTGGDNASGPIYLEWSGFVGNAAIVLAILGYPFGYFHRHNCHVVGCRKFLGTNLDPKVGAPACRDHHSQGHLCGRSHARLPLRGGR
jgi:hypothetical protein